MSAGPSRATDVSPTGTAAHSTRGLRRSRAPSTDGVQLARKHALAEIQARKESAKEFHVAVGVRARPLSSSEISAGDVEAWGYDQQNGLIFELPNVYSDRGGGGVSLPASRRDSLRGISPPPFPPLYSGNHQPASGATASNNQPPSSSSVAGGAGSIYAPSTAGSPPSYPLLPPHPPNRSSSPFVSNSSQISNIVSGTVREPLQFDCVFPPHCDTGHVYEQIASPIVKSALEGYNGTLFAYGQTSSGKTYSLMGTEDEPGIITRAVNDLFASIEQAQNLVNSNPHMPQTQYLVRCSYIEIYNEELRDLFSPRSSAAPSSAQLASGSSGSTASGSGTGANAGSAFSKAGAFNQYHHHSSSQTPLQIVDNPITGPYVRGITEEVVLSPQRVFELLAIGEAHRHVSATSMNYRSSRSHTLFRLVIESKTVIPDARSGNASHHNASSPSGTSQPAYSPHDGGGGPNSHHARFSTSTFPSSTADNAGQLDRLDAESTYGGRSTRAGSYGGGITAGASRSLNRMQPFYLGSPPPVTSSSSSAPDNHNGTPMSVGSDGYHQRYSTNAVFTSGSVVRVSTLHLIDLAGSERVAKSHAEGLALKETGIINASLLTLGVVINKLASGDAHIPYRDSKLTRLLSTSLGGNARTGVLVTISPAAWHKPETRSSLHFAQRAMRVVNRARVNEVADNHAVVAQYKREISQLRAALLEDRGGSIITADGEVVPAEELIERMRSQHDERIQSMEEQIRAHSESAAEAAAQASALVMLCLVASHAVGHIRTAPTIIETLADVASGSIPAASAVKAIVNSVPGFKKRASRMFRDQKLRHIAIASLGPDFLSAAASSVVIDRDSSATPAGGNTDTEPVAPASPRLAGLSLLQSRFQRQGTGLSSGSLSSPRTIGPSFNNLLQHASQHHHRRVGLGLDVLASAATGANAAASDVGMRSDTPGLLANDLAVDVKSSPPRPSDSPPAGLAPTNATGRASGGLHGSLSFDPVATQVDLFMSSANSVFGASTVTGGHAGASLVGASIGADYFTPQSFSKQLLTLLSGRDTLERQVQDQNEALATLNSELALKSTECDSLREHLDEVQAQQAELQARASAATASASSESAASQALKQETASLKAQLTDLEAAHASLQRRYDEAVSESSKASDGATDTINDLKSRLHEAESNRTAHKQQREKLAAELAIATTELSLSKQELQNAQRSLQHERSSGANAVANRDSLQQELGELRLEHDRLTAEQSTSLAVIADLRHRFESVESELTSALRAKSELESTAKLRDRARDDRFRELQLMKDASSVAEAGISAAEAQCHALRMQLAELQGQHDALQHSDDELRASYNSLSAAMEAATAARADALRDRDAAAEKARALEREVVIVRKQLEARDAELRSAGFGRDGIERDLFLARSANGAFEVRVKEAEGRASALADTVAELKSAVSDRDSMVTLLQAKVEGKSAQLTELASLLDEANQRTTACNAKIEERQKHVLELELELSSMRAQVAAFNEEHHSISDAQDRRVKALQSQLQDLRTHIAQAEAAAAATASARVASEAECVRLQTQLNDLRQQVEDSNAREASASSASKSAIEQLTQSLAHTAGLHDSVQQRLENAEARISALQTEVSTSASALSQAQSTLRDTAVERDDCQMEIKALRDHVVKAETSIRALEQKAIQTNTMMSAISSSKDAEALRAASAESRAKTLETRSVTLQQQVTAANAALLGASRERDVAVARLQAAETRIADLTSVLSERQDELEASHERISSMAALQNEAQAAIDGLRRSLALLEDSKLGVEADLQRSQERVRAADLNAQALLARATAAEGQVVEQKSRAAEARSEADETMSQLRLVQQQRVEASARADAATGTVVGLEASLAEATATVDRQSAEYRALQRKLEASQAAVVDLTADLEAATDKIEQAQINLQSSAGVAKDLRAALQAEQQKALSLQDVCAELESNLHASAAHQSELELQLASVRTQISRLNESTSKLEEEKLSLAHAKHDAEVTRNAAVEDRDRLRFEFESHIAALELQAKQQIRELEQQADAAIKSRDRTSEHLQLMEEERDNFATRANALTQQVETLQQDLAVLEQECTRLQSSLEAARSAAQANATAAADYERTYEECLEQQRRCRELERDLADCQGQLEASRAEASSLQSSLSSVDRALHDTRSRQSELEIAHSIATQSITALRKELRQQLGETNAAKDALLQMQVKLASAADEKLSAVSDSNLLHGELTSARNRVLSLQSEVGDLRSHNTRLRAELEAAKEEALRQARAAVAAGVATMKADIVHVKSAITAAAMSASASGNGYLHDGVSNASASISSVSPSQRTPAFDNIPAASPAYATPVPIIRTMGTSPSTRVSPNAPSSATRVPSSSLHGRPSLSTPHLHSVPTSKPGTSLASPGVLSPSFAPPLSSPAPSIGGSAMAARIRAAAAISSIAATVTTPSGVRAGVHG